MRRLFNNVRIRFAVPWVILGTLAAIGGGAILYVWKDHGWPVPEQKPTATETAPVTMIPRWLDGVPIPQAQGQPSAVAIIIDNAPEARPQSGLASASLVFEVPVEGRRTRFLAAYPLPTPSNDEVGCPSCPRPYTGPIGPVRSARPYFVGLADALGAPLVHVGGSNAALILLKGHLHVNQYFDPPFVRDRERPAPFNVYTTIAELTSFIGAQGWEEKIEQQRVALHPGLWPFLEVLPQELVVSDGQDVRVPFSGHESSYVVEWKYDETLGVYIRKRGGAIVRDADGSAVTAKNVVLLTVHSRVLDAIGRLAMSSLEPPIRATPEGSAQAARAVVFRDGKRIEGRWSWEATPSNGGRFGLRQMRDTKSGEPAFRTIPLALGTTWVEAVDFDFK